MVESFIYIYFLPTQTGSDWFHVPLSRQILTAPPTSTNPSGQLYSATDPGVLTEGRVSIPFGGESSRGHSITAGGMGGVSSYTGYSYS